MLSIKDVDFTLCLKVTAYFTRRTPFQGLQYRREYEKYSLVFSICSTHSMSMKTKKINIDILRARLATKYEKLVASEKNLVALGSPVVATSSSFLTHAS